MIRTVLDIAALSVVQSPSCARYTTALTMKFLIIGSLLIGQTLGLLNLTQISFTKLSSCEDNNGNVQTGMFRYGAARAAFHASNRMLYVIGRPVANNRKDGCLRIYNGLSSNTPTLQLSMQFENPLDGELLSIAVCDTRVALSFAGVNTVSEGHVQLYHPFSLGDATLNEMTTGRVAVGPYPKHMAFTSDCEKLVVANEGIPGVINDVLVDPDGEVSIVTRDVGGLTTAKEIPFTIVNGANTNTYINRGVRYVYQGEQGFPNTFSNDLEPEFVAISSDDSKAFVVLQENNAMAVIDLETNDGALVDIYSFGERDWRNFQLDASDTDKAANHGFYDLYSFPQPRVMLATQLNGQDFVITANTGARKSFNHGTAGSFTEGTRLSTLWRDNDINRLMFSNEMAAAIQDNNKIGRLYASENDGKGNTGLIEKLYFYGTRDLGMFIVNSTGIVRQFTTGDEMERSAVQYYGPVFNGDTTNGNLQPIAEMDTRSDDMGPEPRALAGGLFGNSDFPFVIAGTRNGILYTYTLRTGNPALESLYRAGNMEGTWNSLYINDQTGDNVINDMGTIEKNILTTNPFIYVVSEASGSFSIYEVKEV
ncbi:mesenchyme-specific cell surface glycoprotein-like [Mizuhopecten yessoensis]|uniref:mesenchyme-specific cell surface glycoprotein-like n=1 Tax=Mizuhopecten yessoensis TaxID=6573 RepID=UPI000B458B86|nr:mesenchyme-specific cell surface glycoprotein-like [Mizuhopecten yessoensis]